jgi:hypothetical protein
MDPVMPGVIQVTLQTPFLRSAQHCIFHLAQLHIGKLFTPASRYTELHLRGVHGSGAAEPFSALRFVHSKNIIRGDQNVREC